MAAHVDDANFQTEVTQSKIPVLVDFFATWCGPCKMLAPTIDELSEEYAGRAKIVKVDVDQSPLTAQHFGIQSIPTLVFFKDGKPVSHTMGVQSKDTLQNKLDALLA